MNAALPYVNHGFGVARPYIYGRLDARALEAGAASITPPEVKPYRERQCGVQDSFGNTWWISTYLP